MPSSYIIAACRTPIGKLLGGLSSLTAPQLGGVAVAEAVRRSGLSCEQIDEVVLGNVLQAGVGQAPARQAALAAKLPPSVPALTVNKVCGSGLKAVMLADQAIRAGDARTVVAGGMESMSRAPFLLMGAREGWKFGNQTTIDSMLNEGLWCATENVGMGTIADDTAARCHVSREEQDQWSLDSHRRAVAAAEAGAFKDEIVSVTIPGRRGPTVVSADEGPRADAALASLAALRPAFPPYEGVTPTVTAGNASQISDGAAAVVVVDEALAGKCNAPLRARIVATASAALPPRQLFTAPVPAMEQALAKAKLSVDQIDLFEINEAFAAQLLACQRPLKIDPAKLNVNGGAIALGHPIGASGARVLVTLLHALKARGLRRGLAALCLGGGGGVAMIVELE
ncbi:MAG: acetyl-CoA C-acyltransferase [Planctomycetes bacterium]|nr:acetyl-CoA C-acyltransferase [Planctomycetota bacterium]